MLPTVMDLPVVSSPRKRDLLRLLTTRPATTQEVADEYGLDHSTAAFHLRELTDMGLLEVEGLHPKVYRRSGRPVILATDDGALVDPGLTHGGVTDREGDGFSSSSSSSRQVSGVPA